MESEVLLDRTLRETPARRRTVNGDGALTQSQTGRSTVVAKSSASGTLLWWDEVPPQLQFNKYIASGYRANIGYGRCLCSLFQLHNETGNIWAHLGPAILVAIVMGRILLQGEQHLAVHWSVLLPEFCCLMLSTTYHTFMAQITHYHAWLKADVCGVFSLMMVPNFIVLWWGYHCQPHLQLLAVGSYYACALLALITSATAATIFWRAAPMGMLASVRVISLIHRFYLGTSSSVALWHYFWMELLVAIGAFINVYRVPECFLPKRGPRTAGWLDYWGNSHQIMHVLAALAMWHIYQGVKHESDHFAEIVCPK